MGSKSNQAGSSEPGPLTSLSFVPGLLGQAFLGTGLGVDEGGFKILQSSAGQIPGPKGKGMVDSGNVLSGVDAQDPNSLINHITDLLNPNINTGVGPAQGLMGLGNLGSLLTSATGFGNVLSNLDEGLKTGFKPDIQPVIDAATRGFFGQIVPQLGQGNVALKEGVGPFDTDLSSQLLSAGTDLATDLGALETQLQSQAAQTRADLTGISGTLLSQIQNLPFAAGGAALDLGEQLALQGTAGGRQAQLLQLLTGNVPATGSQGQVSENDGSRLGIVK